MILTLLVLSEQRPNIVTQKKPIINEKRFECKSVSKLRKDGNFLALDYICDEKANKYMNVPGYECVQLSETKEVPTYRYVKFGNLTFYRSVKVTLLTACELRCKGDCGSLYPQVSKIAADYKSDIRITRRSSEQSNIPCKSAPINVSDVGLNFIQWKCTSAAKNLIVPGYECTQISRKLRIPITDCRIIDNREYCRSTLRDVRTGCELRCNGETCSS